jgi:hypothetical protein
MNFDEEYAEDHFQELRDEGREDDDEREQARRDFDEAHPPRPR